MFTYVQNCTTPRFTQTALLLLMRTALSKCHIACDATDSCIRLTGPNAGFFYWSCDSFCRKLSWFSYEFIYFKIRKIAFFNIFLYTTNGADMMMMRLLSTPAADDWAQRSWERPTNSRKKNDFSLFCTHFSLLFCFKSYNFSTSLINKLL